MHIAMEDWDSQLGQCLLLRKEPGNPCNEHVIAVLKQKENVCHVPYNLAPTFSMFLRREINRGFRGSYQWKSERS